MGSFEIIGGKKLKGEITPQGAKNEALQVINAVLLTEKEVIINNIPDIIDVNKLIDLLKTLGVKIKNLKPGSYSFLADEVDVDIMTSDEFKKKGLV
jgi:UDP-N-acetylglucosamine 1-carboxyvinyltransferase